MALASLFAVSSDVGGFIIGPTRNRLWRFALQRNVAYAMAFDRSIRQSLAAPVSANSAHFWPRLRDASLWLKTATAFGSRDYSLRLALRFTPTPLLRHGVGRFGPPLRS